MKNREIKFRDKIIEKGIQSIMIEKEKEAREGGKLGFKICRTLIEKEDYERVLAKRRKKELEIQCDYYDKKGKTKIEDYWFYRWGTLQIEWVYEVMKYIWGGEFVGSARATLFAGKLLKENKDLLK